MSGSESLTVDEALEALYRHAEVAWAVLKRGADGLSLEGAGRALETTVDALDVVWAIVGAVTARTEQIRDRELLERREGSALDVVDDALVHLVYGKEGLMVARHLLGLGRSEVLRVARDEV
ncbi:hypothetical protein AB0C21_13815 [Spirillospora sp. NPDC049024]